MNDRGSSYVGQSFVVLRQAVFFPRAFEVFDFDAKRDLLHLRALDDGETWWVGREKFAQHLGISFREKAAA